MNELVKSNGASIGITWHTNPASGFDGRLASAVGRIETSMATGVVAYTHPSKEPEAFAERGNPASSAAASTGTAAALDVAKPKASAGLHIPVTSHRETDMVAELSKSRPVISVDMRGQIIRGSRVDSEDDSSFTIDKYIDDFESVRTALKTEQLAILAYSPAGFFATHYAIRHPERVSALILAEPAVYTEKEDLTQRALLAENGDGLKAMEAMISYIDPGLGPEQKRQLAIDVVKDWQSAAVIGKVFRLHATALISDEMLQPLRKIPTLLIGGSRSPMNFHVKRIAAAVPEAHVWWVKGANHLDIVDAKHAHEIARVVDLFLSSV